MYRRKIPKSRRNKRKYTRRRCRACITHQRGGSNALLEEMAYYHPRLINSTPSIRGIPTSVYMTWWDRKLPVHMRDTVEANKRENPEFEFYIFTDNDCRNFINHYFGTKVLSAFDSLKPGAYKSDLWRYCILYTFGGIYIDIKMRIKVPLKTILETYGHIFPRDLLIGTIHNGIWNGFMAVPPSLPIFKDCIDEIMESVANRDYRRNNLDITGPHLLGRMLEKYKELKEPITTFMMFDSNQQLCMYSYKNMEQLLEPYQGYRLEQKLFQKTKHYSEMYNERDVYL